MVWGILNTALELDEQRIRNRQSFKWNDLKAVCCTLFQRLYSFMITSTGQLNSMIRYAMIHSTRSFYVYLLGNLASSHIPVITWRRTNTTGASGVRLKRKQKQIEPHQSEFCENLIVLNSRYVFRVRWHAISSPKASLKPVKAPWDYFTLSWSH